MGVDSKWWKQSIFLKWILTPRIKVLVGSSCNEQL